MGDESNRRHARIVVKLPITLVPVLEKASIVGGVEDAEIRDLSESGALISVTLKRDVFEELKHEHCIVYIRFSPDQPLPKKLVGRTVWAQAMIGEHTISCRIGVQFQNTPEPEVMKLRAFLHKAATEQGVDLNPPPTEPHG